MIKQNHYRVQKSIHVKIISLPASKEPKYGGFHVKLQKYSMSDAYCNV